MVVRITCNDKVASSTLVTGFHSHGVAVNHVGSWPQRQQFESVWEYFQKGGFGMIDIKACLSVIKKILYVMWVGCFIIVPSCIMLGLLSLVVSGNLTMIAVAFLFAVAGLSIFLLFIMLDMVLEV